MITNTMAGKNYESAIDRAVEKALTGVGAMLVGDVKLRMRVRDIVDTGRLRGSITYATRKDSSHTEGPAAPGDGVDTPSEQWTVNVGTNVEYAQHVEYGTRRMPARPYLRPPLKTGRRRVAGLFHKLIREALKRGN